MGTAAMLKRFRWLGLRAMPQPLLHPPFRKRASGAAAAGIDQGHDLLGFAVADAVAVAIGAAFELGLLTSPVLNLGGALLMPSIGMERFDDEHDAYHAMAQPNCLHSSSQRPAVAENSGLISGSRRQLVRPAAQPRVVHRSAVNC